MCYFPTKRIPNGTSWTVPVWREFLRMREEAWALCTPYGATDVTLCPNVQGIARVTFDSEANAKLFLKVSGECFYGKHRTLVTPWVPREKREERPRGKRVNGDGAEESRKRWKFGSAEVELNY